MKEDARTGEEKNKGSHLLIKVDSIEEGGEYDVLTEEVVKSKALCKFVEMGNTTVDVVIETYSQKVTGPWRVEEGFYRMWSIFFKNFKP